MGVDYAGRPGDPIYALGPGKIVAAGDAWAGAVGAPYPGTWIAERLTGGPLKGRVIYTAEDVTPAVRAGDRVTADTVIGRFTGAGLLETGFADPPGTSGITMAAATGQAASGGDPGAHSTAWGKEMSDLLAQLGAPAGQLQGGGVVGSAGGLPSSGGGGAGCQAAALILLMPAAGLAGAAWELARMFGLT